MKINFDHNADNLYDSIGMNKNSALHNTVYEWMDGKSISRVIEIIITHQTLNDSEKVFCLIVLGQIMSAHAMMDIMSDDMRNIIKNL